MVERKYYWTIIDAEIRSTLLLSKINSTAYELPMSYMNKQKQSI